MMLISRVSDDEASSAAERKEAVSVDDRSHEFQTANELFDLMAKNHNFQPSGDAALTTRDLVILYKNIDLGTKLMSSANDFKKKTPNQYVETVVYNEDHDSDSDITEICSSEDLHNVVLINKERIDLLNNPPSLDNTLCHKFGDFDLQTSDLSIDYDRQCVFKDPYIKEQLKNLNILANEKEYENTVLPASLLDYICCKRLEDNYNFYMDNIIRYVQHTIDQLKRISNGDFLTERAKEKWKEVEKEARSSQDPNNTKILAKCTSIPLHVEKKITGNSTTWDDIVHSEVDVRYLSKILEKKIVVEIPKTISSPYKLFSKCCAGNLIISCKKENRPNIPDTHEEESRVDVVFKLERSEGGQVMSNINSIMIVPKRMIEEESIVNKTKILPLNYEVQDNVHSSIDREKVRDLDNDKMNHIYGLENDINDENIHTEEQSISKCSDDSFELYNEPRYIGRELQTETRVVFEDVTTVPMVDIRDMISRKRTHRPEASFDIDPGDELRVTMQRLSIQSSLPEESLEDMPQKPAHSKKKSPTRNRVKSPYQNNSYFLEEKKRKKLLEIRERREKRKIAMGENCKVTKNKYAKNAIMPVTSSSVTKLSITNKSFYNSIYGPSCNTNTEPKQQKVKERKDNKRDPIIRVPSEHSLTEENASENNTSRPTTSPKYLDHNYYLDDTVTEMMYLKMKRNKNEKPVSDGSFVLPKSVHPSISNIKAKEVSFITQENMKRFDKIISEMDQTEHNARDLITTKSNTIMIVPSNTPKESIDGTKRSNTSSTSIEFRKSIDKIYDLMEKLAKAEGNESKPTKSKFTATINEDEKGVAVGGLDASTAQCSDSGTSVKHHHLSSIPSYISFDKDKICGDRKEYYFDDTTISKSSDCKNLEETPVVVPKVIINNKVHGYNSEKQRSFRTRPMDHSSIQVNDNPLKAISQLLHDIDSVQKIRQKATAESKSPKNPKYDMKNINVRPHLRKNVKLENKFNSKPKLNQGDHMKNPLLDIVDEYKEARGEAVRGPSKINNSRLNTLAQPKKSYVQAHMEEYQTRYGRNVMSDRLQKLSTVPAPPVPAKPRPSYLKNKQKKSGIETAGLTKSVIKSSQSPPIEKMIKYRHSESSNNESMTLQKSQSETPRKHENLPDKPESLKNKMVAVESYVKHHYGRLPPAVSSARVNITSRTPLIPHDLGYTPSIESSINTPDQSSAIGIKLHNIIDTMINIQTELSCVQESNEPNSKASCASENLTKEDRASIMSDYGEYEFDQLSLQGIHQNNQCEVDAATNDVQKVNAQNPVDSELEKLQSALHSKLPAGAFHKRLRIRNFTLTPKHSLQQTVVLHSGDYNSSFIVEPELAQNLKIKNCKSETIAKLKTLSSASNTKLNLNINIPMQITTVGYAFPTLQGAHTSIMRFLKSEALDGSTSIQKQDKPNGMLHNKDHICDSKHRVKFGDFDNISHTVDNPSPENCEGLHKDNSVENGCNDIKTDDVVVKQDMKDLTEKSINIICLSNTDEGAEIFMRKAVDSAKSINSDKVGCSSSLDILVCLLNEIQKITTCELHGDGFDSNEQSKKIMAVLNSGAATLRDSVHSQVPDVVSIVSLDKLRRLESKHSIISFFVSDDNGDKNKHGCESNTYDLSSKDVLRSNNNVYDKEVTVNIQEKELVHAFTDVQSRFLPVTITSGTYMSNSLIGIISEPSTPSLINLNDLPSNVLTAHKKIIEIPRHDTTDVVLKTPLETIEKTSNVAPTVPLKRNEKAPKNSCINSGKLKTKMLKGRKKISDANKVKHKYDSYVNGVTVKKSDALESDESSLITDDQQVMKIKRDVLVTLYSILVFTVFAALSFPEMVSHV